MGSTRHTDVAGSPRFLVDGRTTHDSLNDWEVELQSTKFELTKAAAQLQVVPVLERRIQALEADLLQAGKKQKDLLTQIENLKQTNIRSLAHAEQSTAAQVSLQAELRNLAAQTEDLKTQLRNTAGTQKKREEELLQLHQAEQDRLASEHANQLKSYQKTLSDRMHDMIVARDLEHQKSYDELNGKIRALEAILEAERQESKRTLGVYVQRARDYSRLEQLSLSLKHQLEAAASQMGQSTQERSRLESSASLLKRENSALKDELASAQHVLEDHLRRALPKKSAREDNLIDGKRARRELSSLCAELAAELDGLAKTHPMGELLNFTKSRISQLERELVCVPGAHPERPGMEQSLRSLMDQRDELIGVVQEAKSRLSAVSDKLRNAVRILRRQAD